MDPRFAQILRYSCWVILGMVPVHSVAQEPFLPSGFAEGAQSAAQNGGPAGAFAYCINYLEATPDTGWDPEAFWAFFQEVKRVIDSSLEAMSPDQKREALASVEPPPKTPTGRMMMVYARWLAGDRAQAIPEAMSIVKDNPDSIVTAFVIGGIFQSFYYDLDRPGAAALCKWFTTVAPNNPGTGWAVFRFTFWNCSRKRVLFAKSLNAQMLKACPNTKVAEVAADMNRILEDIQQMRYGHALELLEKYKDYLYHSVALDLVDTFLIGPEWHNTTLPGTKERLDELERVFRAMTNNEHPVKRDFGLVVLGRENQFLGKNEEALAMYQRVIDGGQKAVEGLALKEIGHICRESDPPRAVAALERFQTTWGKSVGGELGVMELADLYLARREHAKALETYQWVEQRRVNNQIMVTGIKLQPRRGMMLSLAGLGRDEDAKSLANGLLQDSGYGKPMSKLGNAELSVVADALRVLGRTDEASSYTAELSRREAAR